MDLIKKYFKNDFLFPSLVSDYGSYYVRYINEKPVSSVLAPITLIILCYYVYIYVRKFYPIGVNCWFCNANFMVAFEDRFEYSCMRCGQFNGFKKDGSYTKTIPEQHDQRYNQKAFTIVQNDVEESKNGLCHKCNIIQEIKVKQLASFVPSKEKNFDWEIEKFKEQLENSLQLCSKCKQYTKKLLLVQEQRYNLKSLLMNNPLDKENINNWPNICSLCLSVIVFILSTENYLLRWAAKFVDTSVFHNSGLISSLSVGITSLFGTSCQAYQCLNSMNKLNALVMFLWALLLVINNFETLDIIDLKLVVSVLVILLSTVSVLNNLTKKPKYRQSSITLENENYEVQNHYNTSSNGSVKNRDKSEMMDIDCAEESPKKVKKAFAKSVDNLFEGLKLNENGRNLKNNIVRPQKFVIPTKRDKMFGYAESSPGYFSSYSQKDDYEFDMHSVYSQPSYRSQFSSLCHQTVPSYTCYAHSPHCQPSPLNLSHSSNSSNIQLQSSEWQKMLMYSIPGIVLLALQCYLLYDIKDFMKQK